MASDTEVLAPNKTNQNDSNQIGDEFSGEKDYEVSNQTEQHLESLVGALEKLASQEHQEKEVDWSHHQKISSEILQILEHLELSKPAEHQEVLKKYDAFKNSAEILLQDVRIFSSHFDKAASKHGINFGGHIPLKKIQNYVDSEEKNCNIVHKQMKLKNNYTRTTLNALRASRKGEMSINERLKQSEAEGLQIKIQQIVNKHQLQDTAIRRLKYRINDCRYKIDQQRALLQAQVSEREDILADLQREEVMTHQLGQEYTSTEEQLHAADQAIKVVKQQRESFHVPSVLDYASTNDRVDRLRKQAREHARKLEIAQMIMRNKRLGDSGKTSQQKAREKQAKNLDKGN